MAGTCACGAAAPAADGTCKCGAATPVLLAADGAALTVPLLVCARCGTTERLRPPDAAGLCTCGRVQRSVACVYACARGACAPAKGPGACACDAPRAAVALPYTLLCCDDAHCGTLRLFRHVSAAPAGRARRMPCAAADMARDRTRQQRRLVCPHCGAAGLCPLFTYDDDVVMYAACPRCERAWNPWL